MRFQNYDVYQEVIIKVPDRRERWLNKMAKTWWWAFKEKT